MPIAITCGCGVRLNAPDAAAGRRVKCPRCGNAVVVPPVAAVESPQPPDLGRPADTGGREEGEPGGPSQTAAPPPGAAGGRERTATRKTKPRPAHWGLLAAVTAVPAVVVGVLVWAMTTTPAAPPTTGEQAEWHPPPPPDFSLKEVAGLADTPIPTTPLGPVVYLEDVDPYGAERPMVGTGLLRRELYRQAMLIAAREELGLTTRDAALGELPPDGLPYTQRLRVHVRSANQQLPRDVRVEAGGQGGFKAVWAVESKLPIVEPIPDAVHTADELSRGGYVTALRRAGGWPAAERPKSAKGIPGDVQAALDRPTVASQLWAVRALHGAVRQGGESPALIGGLSRGYATLGLLTDRLWNGTPWVFKARGLLYAERLRQLDPAAPLGWWHRGYASALAGRHADALKDFAEADAKAGGKPAPGWVSLAAALCRFDSADLAGRAADGPLADTALLFRFRTEEDGRYKIRLVAAGTEFLNRVEECHLVRDCLARSGGLGQWGEGSAAGLKALAPAHRRELDTLPDLPPDVVKAVREEAGADDLAAALEASGREGDDRREVSWAVLGRVIRESRFTLVEARQAFLRLALDVPTDDFLKGVRDQVADHPLFPVLEALSLDPARQRAAYLERLRKAPVEYLSPRETSRRVAHGRFEPLDAVTLHHLANSHGDKLYPDLEVMADSLTKDEEALPFVRDLLEISPYCPAARGRLIDADWESAKPHAAEWEKGCQHPAVLLALARRAVADRRADDAERLLKRALELAKELEAYSALSKLYLARGDEDEWLATVADALAAPAAGLEHARLRTDVAYYYLRKGKVALAREYAERAAETWAEWAMECAAVCAEADGDPEATERWLRRAAERYTSSAHLWLYWCLRTGQGDVENARQRVEEHLAKVGEPPQASQDRMMAAALHLADGRPAKAAPLIEAVYEADKNTFYLMLAAVTWDRAGSSADRDRLLAAVPADDPYAALAKVFRTAIARGEKAVPTQADLDAAVAKTPAGKRHNAHYFAGAFVLRRGDGRLAGRYLEPASKPTTPAALAPVLAGMALRAK